MKLKRAKAYRKLMHQYEIQFGFREPYQVLLDSAILEDADRFKIDIVTRLEGILQGRIKPMVTQCSMRHLYGATPKNDRLIEQSKKYERRRCNHHELEEPLSNLECLAAVVDPKDSGTNKQRYIVASQDPEVRANMRDIAGVPLIYISKSVMLLEPMNSATEEQRNREERSKFRLGLKGQRNPAGGEKRKRDDDDDEDAEGRSGEESARRPQEASKLRKQRRQKGPKQPNPLSMKKAKKADVPTRRSAGPSSTDRNSFQQQRTNDTSGDDASSQRKRRRKHKSNAT